MSRIVVFSDPHVHPFRAFSVNNSRLMNSVNVIRDVFREAHARGVKTVFFCGDMNQEHGKIDTWVINLLTDVFQEMHDQYPDIVVYGISGNHDHKWKNTLDNPAPSALLALEKALPEVFILWDNCGDTVEDIYLCGIPYYEFPEDFYAVLDKMVASIPKGKRVVLLMHQTPSGSIDPIPSQINPKDNRFEKFHLVLNGHIHRHQWFGNNFTTVGSPLQQDLGDIGQEKGILYADMDKQPFAELEHIPLSYPQFRRLKFGDAIPKAWENDYILFDPPPTEEQQMADVDRFGANNSPRDIVQAYGEHSRLEQEIINVGLTLLT